MSGSHAAVSGRGVTDQYSVNSGEFQFEDGKGGIVYQRGYGAPPTLDHGTINRTAFNIKASNIGKIRTENESNFSSNTWLYLECSKPIEGVSLVNNGWTIIRIEHTFSGATWTYKRTDSTFQTYSNGGSGASIGSWAWNIGVKGTGNADAPFRNITSGQNTYRVYVV